MEFLKEVLGEELFSQTKEKVDAYNQGHKDKPVKIVNLSEGNYVSKEKFEAKETELANLNTQLSDANKEIKSYKDMDIDSIKESASNWETKYNDLVKEQNEAKEKSIRNERTNAFFNEVKFASESAKAGVMAQFNEKDFKYDEESKKFLGAKEWLDDLKAKDTGAFLSDVVNPKFTDNVNAPRVDGTADALREAMGVPPEKK